MYAKLTAVVFLGLIQCLNKPNCGGLEAFWHQLNVFRWQYCLYIQWTSDIHEWQFSLSGREHLRNGVLFPPVFCLRAVYSHLNKHKHSQTNVILCKITRWENKWNSNVNGFGTCICRVELHSVEQTCKHMLSKVLLLYGYIRNVWMSTAVCVECKSTQKHSLKYFICGPPHLDLPLVSQNYSSHTHTCNLWIWKLNFILQCLSQS